MDELRTLETSQLIDMLAKHTAEYTKILSEGTTEEDYARRNLTIKALQAEIELRKKAGNISPKQEKNKTKPPESS